MYFGRNYLKYLMWAKLCMKISLSGKRQAEIASVCRLYVG